VSLASALYTGRVVHARHAPKRHRFSYRLFLLYLDLDELPTLFDGSRLWSHERWNVGSFHRRNYLGNAGVPLADAVRARVREATGEAPPGGPIRLLTNASFLGYCFNPVSFYYLFEEDGRTLHSVTAEITNTPWNERFQYVLLASEAESPGEWLRWSFDKEFHVSPFFDMDHRYLWSFTVPGPRLGVAMENHAPAAAFGYDSATPPGAEIDADGRMRVFDAALELERRDLDPRSLRSALLRHPFVTGKVHAAIYWQALRLWLKRTPFFTHPASAPPRPEGPGSGAPERTDRRGRSSGADDR